MRLKARTCLFAAPLHSLCEEGFDHLPLTGRADAEVQTSAPFAQPIKPQTQGDPSAPDRRPASGRRRPPTAANPQRQRPKFWAPAFAGMSRESKNR